MLHLTRHVQQFASCLPAGRVSTLLSDLVCTCCRAVLYNRMKLMLVGVQGIGKTSLLNLLRKEDKTGGVKNKVRSRMRHARKRQA